MKDVFTVTYQITDRGIEYPIKEEEVCVPKGAVVNDCLKKQLNKYRHAMDLTPKFTFVIISYSHSGWSN